MDDTSHSHPNKNPAELGLEVYNILSPYSSDIRQRAIQVALVSLGETAMPIRQRVGDPGAGFAEAAQDFGDLTLGVKASKWIQRHGITRAMLDEVFHLTTARVDVTASSVPGISKREMTVNCYLLCGLRGLLGRDEPSFSEPEAIALCKRLTAYDKNNHTTNRNAVGNKMSGAKPTFMLTGPGETAAADLVKQMTTNGKA